MLQGGSGTRQRLQPAEDLVLLTAALEARALAVPLAWVEWAARWRRQLAVCARGRAFPRWEAALSSEYNDGWCMVVRGGVSGFDGVWGDLVG